MNVPGWVLVLALGLPVCWGCGKLAPKAETPKAKQTADAKPEQSGSSDSARVVPDGASPPAAKKEKTEKQPEGKLDAAMGGMLGGGVKATEMGVEIRLLRSALETYKTELGQYPPSDPAQAKRHLRWAFPRYVGEMKATFSGPDEALHFWLAGPNGNGWSANPQDPFGDETTRIGPFFEFDRDRLDGHAYRPFKRSRDPYVYVRPDAERNYSGPSGSCSPFPGVKVNSYQLHCPGPDGKFGSGGTLDDPTGFTPQRWDDMGNFCKGRLKDAVR